jgi:hypothetical protein
MAVATWFGLWRARVEVVLDLVLILVKKSSDVSVL